MHMVVVVWSFVRLGDTHRIALDIAGTSIDVSKISHNENELPNSNSTRAKSKSLSRSHRSNLPPHIWRHPASFVKGSAKHNLEDRVLLPKSGLVPAAALAVLDFDRFRGSPVDLKDARKHESRSQQGVQRFEASQAVALMPEAQTCIGDGLRCHLGCICGFLKQCRIYDPEDNGADIVVSSCQLSLVSTSALFCFIVIVSFFIFGTCAGLLTGRPVEQSCTVAFKGQNREPEAEPEGMTRAANILEPEGEPKNELYDRVMSVRSDSMHIDPRVFS